MKRNKLIFVMIAVIAIGLFALPATFSYRGAMHTFKQIASGDPADVNAFCMKCHTGDIATQLAASDPGLYQGGVKIHSSIGCQGCHQITSDGVTAQGYAVSAASREHAARLPSCLDCHIASTPFGAAIGDAGTEIRVITEAHQNFKSDEDNDIECIGCHTLTTRTGTVSATLSSPPVTVSGLTIG